jgi:putative CocE/NonD family hydrolase
MRVKVRAVAAFVVFVVLASAAPAVAATPFTKKWGYIKLPDGAQLRYTVLLPEGNGPFPTLMQYEGYQAGSQPDRAANPIFIDDMLAKGYAIFGVSSRGSACSTGVWNLFDEQQANDGAYALDWGATQPWSNGRVGLFSYSYAGIMQTWVATARPKHLVALAPGNIVADTYHDISYPGGVPNVVFPPEWGVALQADWALAAQKAIGEGDAQCLANVGLHDDVSKTLAVQQLEHPAYDAWHHDHSLVNYAKNIDVPVLGLRTWQDEETGSRQGDWINQLDPAKTWYLSSNGNHLVYQFSNDWLPTLEGFLEHFVGGKANGFEKTPHVIVWHETNQDSNPRSVTTQPSLPVKLDEAKLYLGDKGTLGSEPGADGKTSFLYPVPSTPVLDTASQQEQTTLRANTWEKVPYVAAGRAVFTTPPLSNTVSTYGPSSADLWVSTPAPDVDLQVTVTEVRPDGNEVYIQRGWLRASHRAVDPARSTDLDPYTVDTASALKNMPANTPQLLRLLVMPWGHTFRPKSSLRIYVEQPSLTGLWGWLDVETPQTVTILYGKSHPSKLVLGLLPSSNVKPTLPSCAGLLNQACRPNPVPAPGGSLRLTGTPLYKAATQAVSARLYGRRHRGSVLVRVRALGKRLSGVTVELRRGPKPVVRSGPLTLSTRSRDVVLRRAGGRALPAGSYTLVVRSAKKVLLRRAVRLRSS